MWEEWALTCGRNASSERKNTHLRVLLARVRRRRPLKLEARHVAEGFLGFAHGEEELAELLSHLRLRLPVLHVHIHHGRRLRQQVAVGRIDELAARALPKVLEFNIGRDVDGWVEDALEMDASSRDALAHQLGPVRIRQHVGKVEADADVEQTPIRDILQHDGEAARAGEDDLLVHAAVSRLRHRQVHVRVRHEERAAHGKDRHERAVVDPSAGVSVGVDLVLEGREPAEGGNGAIGAHRLAQLTPRRRRGRRRQQRQR